MSRGRASEIPPATDELLAAGQRKLGEGARLNLRGLRPAGMDDDEVERNVDEIAHSYGAHAQIPPARREPPSRPAEPVPSAPAPRTRAANASFRVDLPEYLNQELAMRAARDGATKAYLIIDALHRAGYAVRPEDLVADRRKTRFRAD